MIILSDVQLKEYTERLIDAVEKRLDQRINDAATRHKERFEAQERAIDLASGRAQIVSWVGIIISIVALFVVYFHK